MIHWSEDYTIGVETIDEQHQQLFEIANRIYDLLKNKLILDKYDGIIEIINELKDYTVYHFKEEEAYMESIHYKKFFSQKIAHDDFLAKMDTIDVKQIDNGQNIYLLEILDFVCDWLVHHIIEEDKLIVSK